MVRSAEDIVNARSERYSAENPPEMGSEVQIYTGAFAGMRGNVRTLDVNRRVAGLIIQMFGRQVEPVEVDLEDLGPVSGAK